MLGHHGDTHLQPLTAVALNPRPSQAKGQPFRFGFRVGQLHLLIARHTFSEVVTQAVIYPLPNVPTWFLGVLNQRGNLLPVFDLHELLETGERSHGTRTVLVLEQGNNAVGMLIDGLPQGLTLGATPRPVPPLPRALAAHVPTAYRAGNTVWLEFEHRGFFTTTGAQITRA